MISSVCIEILKPAIICNFTPSKIMSCIFIMLKPFDFNHYIIYSNRLQIKGTCCPLWDIVHIFLPTIWYFIVQLTANISKNMMTSSNGNIFRITGHLCGEFTGLRWIPHKGQWRGALMFSLICARINDWVNNREAGDLRRRRVHYDVTVMNM